MVLFRWIDGADDESKAAVAAGLRALPEVIDTIRDYRFGADAGVNDGNYDYAVVADFDDEAGYVVYRDHPAHRQLIAERIAPLLEERVAVQYLATDPTA